MKFGYEAKAIFCPLTSGKDYATIARTKRKKFGGLFFLSTPKKVDGGVLCYTCSDFYYIPLKGVLLGLPSGGDNYMIYLFYSLPQNDARGKGKYERVF